MSTSKPNIVIFMPEQWRGDSLGCMGHPIVRTPHFDRMAEEGMAFSQCFTTNPICGPARCSFATGWYPHTRGHRTQEYLIREDEPNLFGQLKEAGYHTVWFGKNDMLSESVFRSSIDTAYVPPGKRGRAPNPYEIDDPHRNTFYHGRWDKGDALHWDDLCVGEAQHLIANSLPEPFCVFLPLQFVHPPYWVEEPFFSQYSPDNVGHISPPHREGKPMFMDLSYEYYGLAQVEPEHIRKIRAVYYGMISRTDALFGQLVATLKEAGVYDRTAVFFMADHGNYAGDFGVACKWWTGFDDALTRVPCAVKLPGETRTGVTDALVQIIDVAATILDIAGVESAWPHFGRSMLPLLAGGAKTHREAVFADSGFNPDHETPLTLERTSLPELSADQTYYQWARMMIEHPDSAARACMVRTADWKYVWRARELDELYDLAADPREENNLLHSQPDMYQKRFQALRGQLLEWSILTSNVVSPERDMFGHLEKR